jgi:hypothetical protein
MADNTSRSREQIKGHRKAIEDHIDKWHRYTSPQDKQFALKTVQNAQSQIEKLKSRHPSLAVDRDRLDTWSP